MSYQVTPGPSWLSASGSNGCRAQSLNGVSTCRCPSKAETSRNHGAGGSGLGADPGPDPGREPGGSGGSRISYSPFGFTPRTTERSPRLQLTSIVRSVAFPAAKLKSGSEP